MISLRRFLLALAFWLGGLAVQAEELPIVAKARAFLGGEEALLAVQSIHYQGTLSTDDGQTLTLEIVFQKPGNQRVTVKGPESLEATALNGMEGWQLAQSLKQPSQRRLSLLPLAKVRFLRANTAENLWFYTGLERQGGKAEDQGEVTLDGVVCRKVRFAYAPDSVFIRYFNAATGQLVQSETEKGDVLTEEGEQRVAGIRFPLRLLRHTQAPDGSRHLVTIQFTQITVNESVPPETFAMPLF